MGSINEKNRVRKSHDTAPLNNKMGLNLNRCELEILGKLGK